MHWYLMQYVRTYADDTARWESVVWFTDAVRSAAVEVPVTGTFKILRIAEGDFFTAESAPFTAEAGTMICITPAGLNTNL